MKAIIQQVQVGADGAIVLPRIQVASGTTVEVIVLVPDDDDNGLLAASESSLAFWDNDADRIWDNV